MTKITLEMIDALIAKTSSKNLEPPIKRAKREPSTPEPEAIPSENWWCNACHSSFNKTEAPGRPLCGEATDVLEVAKSDWTTPGRTRAARPARPEYFTTPEGFRARVVKPPSSEDALHNWHEAHGREASLPNCK